MVKKSSSVLGIGNALVDIIHILEDDTLLKKFGLTPGSMTLVDMQLSRQIHESAKGVRSQVTTGGSAANTIHSLAMLGCRCGYIGKIGNDDLGRSFIKEFEDKDVKTHMMYSEKDTGKVMALITPDSERTMATYLGAALDLRPEELMPDLFGLYDYLYIEGYLVQDHKLIGRAVDIASERGLTTAVDLSSFNIVEENLQFLQDLVTDKIDIIFANEEEAFSFTGKQPEEALNELSQSCNIAVVKLGKGGSLIARGDERIKVDAYPADAIDTTGAGDNYAAGFLFGYINGYSLKECGEIASLVSGKVVEVLGAKIADEQWSDIHAEIERIRG